MAEKHNPFRVSITGIDGAGKDTISRKALVRLSEEDGLVIAKNTRPYYRIVNGQVIEQFPRFKHALDTVHEIADRTRERKIIGTVNAANTIVESRVIEPLLTRGTPRPDIVASSRDLRVDPSVYSGYYFPNSPRVANISKLTRNMAALTGIKRDMIIWLQVDPEVAVARIDKRIEEEARVREANGGGSATMRDKWRHLHEDVDSLAALAARYEVSLAQVAELQPATEIITIDTTSMTPEAVSDQVYKYIGSALISRMRPGEEPAYQPAAL